VQVKNDQKASDVICKHSQRSFLLIFYFIGPDNGDRPDGGKTCSSESWWYKIPQGFSCGLGVEVPGFDKFVPVDCSEIVVKVAKAKPCRNNPDLGDDCFNFVNWT
jgi:hypothetical protein